MTSNQILPPRATLDLDAFCGEVHFTPNRGQRLILDAAKTPGVRTICVSAGIRLGKSHCASLWLLWKLIAPTKYPSTTTVNAWIAAPTHSLADRVFQMFCRQVQAAFPELIRSIRQVDGVIELTNLAGGTVVVTRKSCERPISLVGEACDFLVLDEASAVSAEAWQNLFGRLLDRKGEAMVISSPRGTANDFARLWVDGARGAPGIVSVTAPSWANEALDREEIRRMRSRMTADAFAQDVAGQFVAASGRCLNQEDVERAATGDGEEPIAGVPYSIGADLALDRDFTVCTVARADSDGRMIVVHVDRFTRLPWDVQVSRIAALARRYNDAEVRYDNTGCGSAVGTLMDEQPTLVAIPFTFSAASKTALLRHAQVLLERSQVTLLKRHLATTADELAALEYVDEAAGASGHRRFGAPPTAGAFDDAAMSFMLCAKFFAVSDELEGRAFVHGRSTIPEPDSPEPKTVEPPASPPVVGEHADPEIAEIVRRAKVAAARAERERAEHVRRIMGTPKGARGEDGEPGGSWTQRPQRSRFGFDLDLNI